MIQVTDQGQKISFATSMSAISLKDKVSKPQEVLGFIDENAKIYDLHSLIQGPVELTVIRKNDEKADEILQSSTAFILASVLWDMKADIVEIGIKDDAFFCKFRPDTNVSEKDFTDIEQRMKEKIKSKKPFERTVRSFDESKESCEKFKMQEFFLKKTSTPWFRFDELELITTLPMLENSMNCCENFFLQKIGGERFEEFEIQKITGIVKQSKKELQEYIEAYEAAQRNDHRTLGQDMELFHIIPEAPGSIFWLQKGWELYRLLQDHIREIAYKEKYEEVRTPFVMSSSFWEKSGHLASFRENMMFITSDGEESALKPMNCPGHVEIFKRGIKSYKELPLRLAEFGSCHRNEASGALHGLMRVRCLTIDDGHIFCTIEQICDEIRNFMNEALNLYKKLGFDDVEIKLATRPEGFLGEQSDWDYAEKSLQDALNSINVKYEILEGEGAFYGPKIELHVKDALKRSWQLGTIQLDFVLPKRLGASYIDSDGSRKVPCMLHRAILGSLERFIGVLLEHTAGKLPLFLAPVQIAICTVVSAADEYAVEVEKELKKLGMRVILDTRSEKLGYKIREHKKAKVPMIAVIGKEEMNERKITLEYKEKSEHKFENLKDILSIIDAG